MPLPKVSFVAPLYNEEKVFPLLIERLTAIMDKMPFPMEAVLINDGSRDRTPELMRETALKDPRFTCVFLSRNHGHQLALSAGLKAARATDAVMIIDGDLQDPPELVEDFYNKYLEGYEVVYAVRRKRKEGFLKRTAYFTFYRLLKSISYIDIPLDSGDFSLVSRKVLDLLNQMPEESRYLRGMRTWLGFKQIGISYERQERAAGESKYSLKMLFRLAYNGIFNFSEFPVKFITKLGFGATGVGLLYFIYTLYRKIIFDDVPEGFTALIFVVLIFSGVQLISLGVIGEYVLRIFFQVKKRPLFVVDYQITEGKEERK
jgi:dolichol-phosphate mannosyltransferase